ncbi:hypothetical protein F2P56_018670 [Juglans regia]|uniref:Reverse transcriptase domain-containing protein n=2 Tax=Juglans regia TaxID=51240 RepID=A0A833WRV7_JUGRE|nr:uncharacterized protein LOC108997755 [Juglans regia]KAF5462683.1 hypothetical protein F2P56_018670 [Juglans regia]
MNTKLKRNFTQQEVEEAIFNMNPFSSPGPDRFPPAFYQNHWSLVGKEENPLTVSDYRPISLCNVIYKMVSKAIANRLKSILPDIISSTQSAFVPGRLISDNLIVAFEALHTMHSRLGGKEGFMALKLDMSKAYDQIEWQFLKEVMLKMGFATEWVQLNAERTKAITGIPIARRRVTINHLLFADDSLLFCKANSLEWSRMLHVLSTYEKASGQRLNKDKTAIHFSRNTSQENKDLILSIAGVRSAQSYERYLGLPASMGKSRTKSFKLILDKIRMKISSLKVRLLSQAGKEIFIKLVLQAMPTYSMAVFNLPGSLLKEINKLLSNFWWGQVEQERKIHWTSWKNMGRAKAIGGMGFRELHSFNLAMLPKQAWRLIHYPQALVSKVLKAKYFPHGQFLNAKLGHKPSYIWRSIMAARDVIVKGTRWRVGNGASINILQDKWIPRPTTFRVQATCPSISIGDKEEAEIIQQIPLSPSNCEDKLIWLGTPQGINFVKSAYHMLREMEALEKGQGSNSSHRDQFWKRLWKLRITPTAKNFMWRDLVEELAMVAKRIWMRRNEFVFKQEFKSPNSLAELAISDLRDMRKMQMKNSTRDQRLHNQNVNWNHTGSVVATSRLNRPLYPDPALAEAIGALEATRLCHHLGLTNIILEGDALQVIQAINSRSENWSSTGMIMEDVKGQLSTFESWSAIHIRREGNKAAHELARNALVTSTSSLDVDCIPSCIINFI